ncbi:iron complex transport system substrate-binding protein [Methanophagales archaeon]|nr:iron complex transport system substrate-binding protein [Methanophagales archaeon]
MKMKRLAFMGIVVLLCSLFLAALPATTIAAEEVDFVLDIYGNANEDDTIDMRDLTYVKLIFFGEKSETEFADAKYDGEINPLDFVQIKLVIVGKEEELTIVDTAGRIVTIKKPVEWIVTTHGHHVETLRALKLEMNRIVGLSQWTLSGKVFFPEFSEEQSIGGNPYDIEKMMSLQPDMVMIYTLTGTGHGVNDLANTLESAGITVLRIDCYKINNYVEEIRKLGYILDKEDESDEFTEFYEREINDIIGLVDGIPEENRPKVYFEGYKPYYTIVKESCRCLEMEMAGGNNIFDDLEGYYYNTVDPEEVIKRNPEIIIKEKWPLGGYSTTDITELKTLRDEIMNRPELANVTAVKNGNVYVIGSCFLCKPKRFVGIAYMAKWFHPNLFNDLDPEAIHQEYLDRFHKGLHFNVHEDGFFVYPALAS